MKRIYYIMSLLIAGLAVVGSSFLASAQTAGNLTVQTAPAADEAVATYQALLDLNYPFTIMCMAAHPDDEDSDTLAYFRYKYGARTVIVTSTRGEGGQNSQGPELQAELGVVRVRELAMAAAKLDAATFNLALPEFGFSKSSEETFKYWNRKEALRRMVYAIRFYRPDIIITQHDRKTGHGHHQATRILAEEALELAADRYSFPEQISGGLEPWQVKRFFARTISKSRYDTEFDVHETAPLRNRQYSRLSYESRLEHRTQGPWPQPDFTGERMVRYNLIKNKAEEFRRWYLFGQGIEESPAYQLIRPVIFDERAPGPTEAALLPRAELLNRLTRAINTVRAYIKADGKDDLKARDLELKLQRALLVVTKLALTINSDTLQTSPGLDLNIKTNFNNQSSLPIEIVDLRFALPAEWEYKETSKLASNLDAGAQTTADYAITLSPQAATTLPATAHLYETDFQLPQINAIAKVRWKELNEPIIVTGQTRVEVAPAVELKLVNENIPVNISDVAITNSYTVQVKIVNNLRTPLQGRVKAESGQAIRITPDEQQFSIGPASTGVVSFFLTVGRPVPEGTISLPMRLNDNFGRELAIAPLNLHLINARVIPQVRVGYLRSFDFTLPQALQFLGVKNSELTVNEIAAGSLINRYDTILLDNRAYLAHPELVKVNGKLLDFVKDGGTLIVLYQRPADWNSAKLSPYPIKLGDDRVTEEAALLTILTPEQSLMNRPNKITSDDFNNWVQERGLSFPAEWDERYRAVLSSNDEGEEPLKGGMLIGEYGRGQYLYTSYVIYRQLRAYHSGAFRIFANMISMPKTR